LFNFVLLQQTVNWFCPMFSFGLIEIFQIFSYAIPAFDCAPLACDSSLNNSFSVTTDPAQYRKP